MYREGHVIMEAALEVMPPPSKDQLKSSETGQSQVEHLDPLRGAQCADMTP